VDAFLETTAIADLLFKDKGTSGRILEILSKYKVKYSSQYVRMEIKRGVLRHFVYLHNKAVECKKLSEVHACISTLSSTPQKNKLSTVLKAIEDFYANFEQRELRKLPVNSKPTEFQKSMLAAFLRTRIRRFWTAFEKQVDIIVDDTECYKRLHVLKPPTFDGKVFDNTFSNCDKFKPGICRLRDFCNDNENGLVDVHTNLSKTQKPDVETEKRLRAIKEVLRVKKRDILQRECWRMSDALMVLEAPANSEIINGNCKHYDALCNAVGKVSVCYRKPAAMAKSTA